MYLAVTSALLAATTVSQAADPGGQLEEVIVTAQKRTENLQDVPISVQALNAAALEKNNVVSVADIRGSVPSLTIQPYPGQSETLYPSVRGIVPNQAIISAPIPMAIHLNGVYVPLPIGLNSAVDMERVEVLKGPQGVMSGRNATGGALNIYTAKPDLGDFWFKQQFTIAERDQFLSKTVVNVPVGERFAARVSYINSSRDSEGIHNSAPGGYKFGERDAESWRLDLRWKPIDNLLVDYGYDYGMTKSLETPNQCLLPFPGIPSAIIPGCDSNYHSSLYAPYQLPKSKNKAEGHTLNVSWDVTPALTIRSITGYRKVDTSNNSVFVGTARPSLAATPWLSGTEPLNILGGLTPFNGQVNQDKAYLESWSQELQFLGEVNKNLKYTVGLYYSKDEGNQALGPRLSSYMAHVIPPMPGLPAGGDVVRTLNHGVSDMNNRSEAIFGQLSWRPDLLDQKLEVVPGIRFTRDHREATGFNMTGATYRVTQTGTPLVANLAFVPGALVPGVNYVAGNNLPSMSGNLTFYNTSPSIAFNYHWSDAMMGYVKYSTAYTSGGFDPSTPDPAAFSRGFEPEKIKSIELGFKGEFLDRRLRTNAAVFQSKYTNEQKTAPVIFSGIPTWIIQNAGKSSYKGVELDVTAAATNNLRFSANGSWLYHKYASYVIGGVDVTNETRSIVPKLSYSLAMDYRFPDFGLPGKLDGNLNVYHKDKNTTPFTPSTMPAGFDPSWLTTPAYTVWNGRLSLSKIKVGPDNKGDLTVALWVRNLADKKYFTYVAMNAVVASAGSWGERRTTGLDLIYRY